MKKINIVTGLIMVAMLSACNLFNKKDSEEFKIEKYENEVTYADFSDSIDKIGEEMSAGWETAPDQKTHGIIISNIVETLKSADGAQLKRETKDVNLEQDDEYDVDTDISKSHLSGTIKTNSEAADTPSVEETTTVDVTRQYQAFMVGEVKNTASVNESAKEYYNLGEYKENEPEEQGRDGMMAPALVMMMGIFTYESETATAEEKAQYHFYHDEGVYTLVCNQNETDEKTHYVGGEKVKYADKVTIGTLVAQIVITKKDNKVNSVSYYCEVDSTETTTYVTDFQDYYENTFTAGQVVVRNSKVKSGARLTVGDISLAAIDLSEYTLKDEDPDYKVNILELF